MVKNLFDIVDGSEAQPGEDDAQVKQDYESRKKKAAALLVTSIKTVLYYLLTSCNDDPNQMWNALRGLFEKDTTANKLFLKKQLVTLRDTRTIFDRCQS